MVEHTRLTAAAPELLATLEFVGRALDRMIDDPASPRKSDLRELSASIHAAIAKTKPH